MSKPLSTRFMELLYRDRVYDEDDLLISGNSMDPFTLTDAAGTFAFDGTQGVYTSADGSTTLTFTSNSTVAPAADPIATAVVTTVGGVVTNLVPQS